MRGSPLQLLPTGVCFAGDTVIQVRDDANGRAVPTKIRNVKTGQHILCMDTSEDLRLPTKATWCEVINWVSCALQLHVSD
jgi:hypothetical protein